MDLTDAARVARGLMIQHGLKGWQFAFDRATRRFGYCDYRRKRISLSASLVHLNSSEHVTDTILHEIAHALCGPGNGHNEKWKDTARRIGCRPKRCYVAEVVTPQAKYTAQCPGCGKTQPARRRSKVACRSCCQKFNGGQYTEQFSLVYTLNERPLC